jgi:hypothetical protein
VKILTWLYSSTRAKDESTLIPLTGFQTSQSLNPADLR